MRYHNICRMMIETLEKSVWGVAAVDLENRSCSKDVGNPVVTSVDIQTTVEIPTRSLPFFWYLLIVSLLVQRASLCKHGVFSSA